MGSADGCRWPEAQPIAPIKAGQYIYQKLGRYCGHDEGFKQILRHTDKNWWEPGFYDCFDGFIKKERARQKEEQRRGQLRTFTLKCLNGHQMGHIPLYAFFEDESRYSWSEDQITAHIKQMAEEAYGHLTLADYFKSLAEFFEWYDDFDTEEESKDFVSSVGLTPYHYRIISKRLVRRTLTEIHMDEPLQGSLLC